MRRIFRAFVLLLAAAAALCSTPLKGQTKMCNTNQPAGASELRFAAPFQSGMILQQDVRIPVWGKAAPKQKVKIVFAGQALGMLADENGNWHGTFSPVKGSYQEYEMTLSAGERSITLQHVLVGEVWICAGQSNMQHELKQIPQFELAKLQKDDYAIAQLRVPMSQSTEPLEECKAVWTACRDEKALAEYTALGWFFAYELADRLHVPVGIINISRGGTVVEAWTPEFMYRAEPEKFAKQLNWIEHARKGMTYAFGTDKFQEVTCVMRHNDPGNEGFGKGWAGMDAPEPELWRPFPVPNQNSVLFGEKNGAYWLRKEVDVPENWLGKDLTLELGVVDDLDTTYFNGEQVGFTDRNTPNPWDFKRVYTIPAKLVRKGGNVIAVRDFDEQQAGGMFGPELNLVCGEEKISLKGEWRIRAERILHQIEYPENTFSYYVPGSLFNAMFHPISRLPVRGVIWHQGENNAWNSEEYGKYFPMMIQGWRQATGIPELPFIPALMHGFSGRARVPAESSWAELREAVRRTGLTLPAVYPVTLADIHQDHDVHFHNKSAAGRRMARAALAAVYKKLDIDEAFGPAFKSVSVASDGAVTVSFDHADGICFRNGDSSGQFALAGEDGIFHWADTVLPCPGAGTVVLRCKAVPTPKKVRYAWATNPNANLCSGGGLPAYPFEAEIK